ncbi:MAG: hypothetical protein CMO80_21295 [Verrucomicrobiales bacterium]|nr:hypothetical protein [Verrucomicrobiales bacterium]
MPNKIPIRSTAAKIWGFIFALPFLALGVWLTQLSFEHLQDMRSLTHLPPVKINEILPGEVRVTAKINSDLPTSLNGPITKTACYYFEYIKEEKGDDTWETTDHVTLFSNFVIQDDTGKIRVEPDQSVAFDAPTSHYEPGSGVRQFEKRLDAGTEVTVVGYAEKTPDGMAIKFEIPGAYVPKVTIYNEVGEQGDRGFKMLVKTVGASICFGIFVVLLYGHDGRRIIVFLSLIFALHLVVFGGLGIHLIYVDLKTGFDSIRTSKQHLRTEIDTVFDRYKLKWSGFEYPDSFATAHGLPLHEATRLDRMRINLARQQSRLATQQNAFPERYIAPLLFLPKVELIPLTDSDLKILRNLESEITGTRLFSGKSEAPAMIALGIGSCFGLLMFWFGIRCFLSSRFMENVPTTPSTGVAYGLAEVSGWIDANKDNPPKPAPFSGRPRVYFQYRKLQKTGTSKDSWKLIDEQTHLQIFDCRDDHGSIKVFPHGAKLPDEEDLVHVAVKDEDDGFRHIEYRIEPDDPVYVLGHAEVDPFTGDSLMITQPREKGIPFIVSNQTEEWIFALTATGGMLLFFMAFTAFMTAYLMISGMYGSFSPADYLAAACVGPLVLGIIAIVFHYNDLVFLRQRVERNWSNIDISLKKRSGLIPGLGTIVSEFLAHEKELQNDLAQMRSWIPSATSPENATEYLTAEHQFTTRYLGLREAHPNLRGNALADKLTKTLIELENEIALMRDGYNRAVEIYNPRIALFPDLLLAKLGGFLPADLLQFESAIQHASEIQLGCANSSSGLGTKSFDLQSTHAHPTATPLPPSLIDAAHQPTDAFAIVISLILTETRFNESNAPNLRQLLTDESLIQSVDRIHGEISAVDEPSKLLLIDQCLPAIRKLPESTDTYAIIKTLIEWDSSISLFEYTLIQIFEREHARKHDADHAPITQWHCLTGLEDDISQISSFLANLSANPAAAENISNHFQARLGDYKRLTELPLEHNTFDRVDQALNKLSHLDAANRRLIANTASEALGLVKAPTTNQVHFARAISERLYS